jgi:hypothetical protein
MRQNLGSYLKTVVAAIIGIEIEEAPKEEKKYKVENPTKEVTVKHKRTDNEIVERKYKAPPKIKPKRRDLSLSEWDYKDKRKEYMQEYRGEGKDLETGNRYVKKIKEHKHG